MLSAHSPHHTADTSAASIDASSLTCVTSEPDDADLARADLYALSARLLLLPPDAALLAALAAARIPAAEMASSTMSTGTMEQAWEQLGAAAAAFDVDAVREEFDALFISLGTPLINPYACFYLTGFLMEKPLAALRDDLQALGLMRRHGVGETEDHFGLLCETMRLLILGLPDPGRPLPAQPLTVQKTFFLRYIAPWYESCLQDLQQAEPANFYRVVAQFMQTFLEIERKAFALIEDAEPAPK